MQSAIGFLKQRSNLVIVIVIIIVGFALYGNALNNELFWDDDQFILENQYIRDFSNFPRFFSENVIAGALRQTDYWRPALLTVFAIEWHLWGPSPFGFHLTNTLFHLANAIVLFFILEKIFHRRWLSLFASVIFLIHPLQTEAVSYANSLGDSLSVFFMFLGLIWYLKGKHVIYPLIAFALALMSKETAIIFPALIFLAQFFTSNYPSPLMGEGGRRPGEGDLKAQAWLAFKKTLPYIGLAVLYILLRATVLNFGDSFNLYHEQNIFTSSVWVRILTFFRILAVYFYLIFWPQILHMERSVDLATSFFQTDVILGALIFVTLLAIAFLGFKKYPVLTFGLLWFFIGLAPTSNIAVPINGLLYEHWLYVPIIGIALAVFELGSRLVKNFPKLLKPVLAAVCLIFLALNIRTIARNNDWDNSLRFYNQVLAYAPESYRVTNNLGMEYAERGFHEQAIFTYYKAIALDDSNPVAYHNLANSYRDTGKFDLAVKYYEKAIELDPKFFFSYAALYDFYTKQNKPDEAKKIQEAYESR
ncbi:MAG: tetratricopeptide repeat protein [Candidatus Doudnabacteria bacterium]|nr:tetratricopeptide repeat protein [Candidatus Doudnabacteria bacterium]